MQGYRLAPRCGGESEGRRIAAIVAAGLVLVHLARPLAAMVAALAVLLVMAVLLLALLVPFLFLLGWAAESACSRLGLHLPDPGALRGRFRVRVVRPLLETGRPLVGGG